MSLPVRDPRLPLVVGVGELVRRPGEDGPTEPAELTAEAVRRAVDDAGAGKALLRRVGALAAVPSTSWGDGDPGRRVGELLRLDAPTLRGSMQGGNGPQLLVTTVAERIAAGGLEAAVVCGGEALHTLAELTACGEPPPWPEPDPGRRPAEVIEGDHPANTEAERAVGLIAPIVAYPLIENALRVASGRSAREHLELIARLWSRFTEVAAAHPCAWTREVHSAEELRTPSPSNRRVTLPYTKLMNSNLRVDQAAALVLCSAGTARDLGIPRDRWVFVHAGASAIDEWFLSERRELHCSPAIRACGDALFDHVKAGAGDLGPVDLYSCFPAAVELAAGELDLPIDDVSRPLTCTGGLTFFGGPGSNYATHGVAAVVRRLREAAPGTLGLATALGWYATKHALGVYGNAPPARQFAALRPKPEVAARSVAEPLEDEAVAETGTIVYERDGSPSYGILFALLDDGRRALAHTRDPDAMAAMEDDAFLGSRVRLGADRSFRLM